MAINDSGMRTSCDDKTHQTWNFNFKNAEKSYYCIIIIYRMMHKHGRCPRMGNHLLLIGILQAPSEPCCTIVRWRKKQLGLEVRMYFHPH